MVRLRRLYTCWSHRQEMPTAARAPIAASDDRPSGEFKRCRREFKMSVRHRSQRAARTRAAFTLGLGVFSGGARTLAAMASDRMVGDQHMDVPSSPTAAPSQSSSRSAMSMRGNLGHRSTGFRAAMEHAAPTSTPAVVAAVPVGSATAAAASVVHPEVLPAR